MVQSQTNQPNTSSLFNFDTKRFLFDMLHHWWLFLITIPLCLFTVFLIHRYTLPTYNASIALLLEERGDRMPQSDMMEGFGLTPGQQNVENQIAILTSWDIIEKTIDKLDFHLSYYISGRVKHTEMYDNPPFKVVFDSLHCQILNTPIVVDITSKDTYTLKILTEQASSYIYKDNKPGQAFGPIEFEQSYRFGDVVDTPWGRFIIKNTKEYTQSPNELYFIFNHPQALAAKYKYRLKTYRTDTNSSIVNVSVSGKNELKNIVFLNKLAEVFISNNLEQKNKIATNTINFIEDQLVVISDSLYLTGSQLSQFRTSNRIQSVSAKAEYLFKGLQEMEQQLTEHEITRRYYIYLKNYFSQDFTGDKIVAPAQYDIKNNLLNESIKQIIELNSQRLSMRVSFSEDMNLAYKDLQNQIQVATKTILKTINSQLAILDETVRRVQSNKEKNETELYQLPETERRLLGIERKFELSNEVYTFLLRKHSESQIQKASNTPDHKVLESAQSNGQIAPNVNGNQKKALMLGLILPLAFIALRQLLNNKIIDQEDIEKLTNMPILGQILHNSKNENNVSLYHPKSVITESFRRVRTRLDFMNQEIKCPVIGVTSSIPGEGKTFCTLNIAAALALSGKKSVILGFDMRKPGLNKLVDTADRTGISNYLIGKATYEEIKIPQPQENLTIIPSGDIPPNPSELISSKKTQTLFNKLKEEFDVIVIDTPPMGIVSDPFLLARYTDTLIFLVRQNHSIKKIVEQTLRNISEEGIENVGILLNDLNMKKGYGYGYNYHYNYGYRYTYGQGYYED